LTDFTARFGVMVATTLLVSPIVWDHYLLVAAIPCVIIAGNLRALAYPHGATALAVLTALLLVLPGVWSETVPEWFARPSGAGYQLIPAAASLLGLMPAAAVLAAGVLCAATSRTVEGRTGQ